MSSLTTTKTEHPADGSPRWIVAGPAGQVVYDVLGNHLALLFADGEIDAMGKEFADRVGEYARLDDDDALFAVLADHYRVVLDGAR